MKRIKLLVLVLAVVWIGTAFSGCLLLPAEEEVLVPPLVEAAEITYVTEPVERGDLVQTKTYTGRFVTTEKRNLSYDFTGGKFGQYHVVMGQEVKAGDPLISLQTASLEREIERQEDAVELARLDLKHAMWAQIESSKIRLAAAERELEYMKQDFEKSTIVAPFDGKVTYVDYELSYGDPIDANRTVVTVTNMAKLELVVEDEQGYVEFYIGMPVTVKIGDSEYSTDVVMTPRTAPEDMKEEIGVKVFLKVNDFDYSTLKEGQSVQVFAVLAERKDVLMVHNSMIVTNDSRTYVTVLDEEGIKRERDVVTGIVAGTYTEIIEGVEEGEELVQP